MRSRYRLLGHQSKGPSYALLAMSTWNTCSGACGSTAARLEGVKKPMDILRRKLPER
jgi:hypothetical protein